MSNVAIIKDEFVGTTQAAELLGLTDGRIRQLIRSKELRAEKIGPRYWAISVREIKRYDRDRQRRD